MTETFLPPDEPCATWSRWLARVLILNGWTETSGRRSVEHNKAVGGKPNSRHLRDAARDFTPPKGVKPTALRTWLQQLAQELRAMSGLGIGVGIYPGHVHIDFRPGASAWWEDTA